MEESGSVQAWDTARDEPLFTRSESDRRAIRQSTSIHRSHGRSSDPANSCLTLRIADEDLEWCGNTYHDEDDKLRNNIARFQCPPGSFSVKPTERVLFTDVFARHPSDAAHMVGGMAVKDGLLYVGVGDAEFPQMARNLSSPLGKVLRMTLDGDPVADNPHYVSADRSEKSRPRAAAPSGPRRGQSRGTPAKSGT